MVVIVMAIVSAVILGLFDFVWSNLTELVYADNVGDPIAW